MKQTLLTLLLLTGMGQLGQAQVTVTPDTISEFTFTYFVNGVPSSTPTAPNGFIQFPNTNAGNKAIITVLATSSSALKQNYTITNATVSGPGFALATNVSTLLPGGTGTMQITFSPTASNPAQTTGFLQFQLVGDNGQTFSVLVTLFATVLQPQLVLSYVDSATGNQLPLSQGGILQFPATPVNTSAVAKIVVVNNGNGSGIVNGITLSGAGFSLTNEPLTPATVAAGSSFTAGITFTPTTSVEYKGTVTVTVGGVATTFNLDGVGTSSAYTYTLLNVAGNNALQPGATITLPDTPADGISKSSLSIQVQNTGNQSGTLASIAELGSDFSLSNLPILPVVLTPGNIAVFNVVYQPAKPGASVGRLQIGNDLFNLAGNGLGSAISLAVDVGVGATAVANKGLVSLPIVTVGSKQLIYVDITNTGNQSTVITGVGVSGTGFTIPNPPAASTLSPSQTIQFTVQFAPLTVGSFTGTVTINDQSISLLGSGQAPPALPSLNITNVASVLAPLQQPSAGLQLSSAYPYDVTGVMTLSFLSDSYVDDPAIQFATGGRTINFVIPANTTQAVFNQASGAPLGSLAGFQTGTESGSVSLTVSGLTVGQVNVTPASLPTKSFQIPAAAPVLRSLRVTSFTTTQLVLLVTGYSTPRNLSQLNFALTGTSGLDLVTTSLPLDVSGPFAAWYGSSASDTYGSQFSVTVTMPITGDSKALQTVSVTATNSKGTSAAQSVTLQ